MSDQDLAEQRQLLKASKTKKKEAFQEILKFKYSGDASEIACGEELLSAGRAGTIILAGGQGTRLGFPHPKGLFPVTPVKKKSLFQLFAEKTHAICKKIGKDLPLAIMTSEENQRETKDFFLQNGHFGLKDLSFFSQGLIPFLNLSGELCYYEDGTLATGPDGNGRVFYHFVKSGLFETWKKKNIQVVNIVLVDNPLADPFDANLIGHHLLSQAEATVKCISRENPRDKVGLLIEKEGRIKVIEYSEIDEEESIRLKNPLANLSLFSLSIDFIEKLAGKRFPLHIAYKDYPGLGTIAKFETFIFDMLEWSKKTSVLVYPADECFQPLKNPDDPVKIALALEKKDRKQIETITGLPVTLHPLEIDQEFYYPTPHLLEKWKGRMSTDHYIKA